MRQFIDDGHTRMWQHFHVVVSLECLGQGLGLLGGLNFKVITVGLGFESWMA
jgi:hypothetical protein